MTTLEIIAVLSFAISLCVVLGWLITRPIAAALARREERLEMEAGIRQFGGYNRSKYRI